MEDGELASELDFLDWMESEYGEDQEWVPKDSIPKDVFEEMEKRGKFVTEGFSYYLSKKGNLTRYVKGDGVPWS